MCIKGWVEEQLGVDTGREKMEAEAEETGPCHRGSCCPY